MVGDPQGRPEIIARQDWGKTKEGEEAREAGLKFGLEGKAFERLPADFDSAAVIKCPFGIHSDNYALTKLLRAEEELNPDYQDEFWAHAKCWAGWAKNLGPERLRYVNYHGADLGGIPPMDENRLNCLIEPMEWLARAKWHEGVFYRLIELGVPATLEWVYVTTYYGPPYFPPNWLPLLCFQPRVGIWKDVERICKASSARPLVDFEHLESSREALSGESLEIKSLTDPKFASTDCDSDFEKYFGFSAERGRICRFFNYSPFDGCPTWESIVKQTRPSICHIGGIQGQLVKLTPEEADTPYHHAIHEQVADPKYADVVPNPAYVQDLIRYRRGGSHAPVSRDDNRMREMLRCVLSLPHEQPPFIVVETADYAEGKDQAAVAAGEEDPGYWYWAPRDAMRLSLHGTWKSLMEEMS